MAQRTVALPPAAVAALRAHRDRQSFERQRLGDGWADYGLVFCTPLGTAISGSTVAHAFKRALERAGLPRSIRFHDLRHAHATLLRQAGVDLKTVSERLGHSTIAITADLYTHAVSHADADAAARVETLLQRQRGG